MISESSYWKDDLLRQAKALRVRMIQKHWPQTSFVRVEQCLMLSFYNIRKLLEAQKLSQESLSKSLYVTEFPSRGMKVDHFNWHRIEDLCDFSKATRPQIGLKNLCNQFVHSYVFQLVFGEDSALDGVFVISDRERDKRLYLVDISQIVRLFESIGQDYPAYLEARRDQETGDWRIRQRPSPPKRKR
jgi:hypothetical protein